MSSSEAKSQLSSVVSYEDSSQCLQRKAPQGDPKEIHFDGVAVFNEHKMSLRFFNGDIGAFQGQITNIVDEELVAVRDDAISFQPDNFKDCGEQAICTIQKPFYQSSCVMSMDCSSPITA
ncbi:hypothetical protein MIR68_009435 [Amoeboaphelidium protococcarum]|nr:hypothetical protein MIR68_009435 [Amoeboaphelidium protococcarum]